MLGSGPPAVKEIQAVRKACEVLEAVVVHQPVGVSELARLTGIDKSAVQRIAVTLHAAGWLHTHPAPPTRWEISPANPVLRHAAASGLETLARPAMERLRDQSGETVLLVIRSEGRLLIGAAAESRQPVRLSPTVGFVLPFDGSSAAAAIAASLPAAELEQMQAAHPSLDDRTLDAVRRRGWSVNDREVAAAVRAVAAPVRATDGYPVAALCVCGPSTRVSRDDLARLGALVAVAAREIVVGVKSI
jgi:IclR family acetate operon transcriptional repressor